MIEKLLDFLLADPIKFVLASSVLGVFYIFKTYDARIDSIFKKYSSRMDIITNDIRDNSNKLRDEINVIKHDMMKDFFHVKDDIKQIEREVNYLLEKFHSEITQLQTILKSSDIKTRLEAYEKELKLMSDSYGKVIWIKEEIEKRKQQDEIHYKMFLAIADNIKKLAARK